MIVTECNNCIFAKFTTDQFGQKDQIGCFAQRIKKFEAAGEAQYCYNQDTKVGSFKVTRVCNLKTIAKPPEQSLDDALDYAKFNANNIFDVIIYVNDRNSHLVDKTVKSINNQLLPVHKTRLAVNCTVPPKINKALLRNYMIHYIVERQRPWLALDVILGNISENRVYYCFVKAGTELPENLFKNVASYMNDLLLPALVVYDKNFLIMQVRAHKTLGGSQDYKITTKLRELYSVKDQQKYILSYDEIKKECNTL